MRATTPVEQPAPSARSAGAAGPVRPLRRDPAHRVVGGVCAGLARRLDIDPLIPRVAFVATAVAGGIGFAVYALAWAFIPAEGSLQSPAARIRGRPGTWQVSVGAGLLVLGALLLFRELGVWFSDVLVWPVVIAAAGGALIWRQSSTPSGVAHEPAAPTRSTLARDPGAHAVAAHLPLRGGRALGRVGLGAALVVGAGLLFLQATGALGAVRDVTLAVVVAMVALVLILAPWWWRLVRGLAEERAGRIRSQERAELAAHLHDSVLQTLAMVQRRAGDPREVAALARRQERELRSWLSGGPPARADESLSAALEAAAAEVEEAHGVPVEVVTVGDAAIDARAEALVAAAREALVNAAKFAGAHGPVSLYAEARDGRLEVFVRDRGPGFDPTEAPADRHGVRESIVGRMERAGGRAQIHTAPQAGTEVELSIDRAGS